MGRGKKTEMEEKRTNEGEVGRQEAEKRNKRKRCKRESR